MSIEECEKLYQEGYVIVCDGDNNELTVKEEE